MDLRGPKIHRRSSSTSMSDSWPIWSLKGTHFGGGGKGIKSMARWWLLVWSWAPPQVSTSQLKTCFTHLDPTSSNTFCTTEDGRFGALGLGWHFPSKSNMQYGQSMTSIKVKVSFWKRKGISGKIDDIHRHARNGAFWKKGNSLMHQLWFCGNSC